MLGMVNQAIEDLVVEIGGNDLWETVKQKAGVEIPCFLRMETYPDSVTYQLVGAASEVLGKPPAEILRAFGRHWILYTGQEGYGPLVTNAGKSIREVCANLGQLHALIRSTMPEVVPPRFEIDSVEGEDFRLHYFSHRAGLGPMVIGLIEGLGELFKTPATVTYLEAESEKAGHGIFQVQIQTA